MSSTLNFTFANPTALTDPTELFLTHLNPEEPPTATTLELIKQECETTYANFLSCGYTPAQCYVLTYGHTFIAPYALYLERTVSNAVSAYIGKPVVTVDDYLAHAHAHIEHQLTLKELGDGIAPQVTTKKAGRPALPEDVVKLKQQQQQQKSERWVNYLNACNERRERVRDIKAQIADLKHKRQQTLIHIDAKIKELHNDLKLLQEFKISKEDF